MYLGKICEVGESEEIIKEPAHPYTQALIDSILDPNDEGFIPDVSTHELTGEVSSFEDPPSGCRFHRRCPLAQNICKLTEPTLSKVGEDRFVACHFPLKSIQQDVADEAITEDTKL